MLTITKTPYRSINFRDADIADHPAYAELNKNEMSSVRDYFYSPITNPSFEEALEKVKEAIKKALSFETDKQQRNYYSHLYSQFSKFAASMLY